MKEIKRDKYLNKLIMRKENGLVKVITGIRRCGKSYLLFNLFYNYLISSGVKKDHIITIALDDEDYNELRDPKMLSKYIKERIDNDEAMHYVFIDEIQYAISSGDLKSGKPLPIYGVLNGLMHLTNVDVYVTGSNSKLLSKDVMTEFRGRGDEIRVYPLTFKEVYDYLNVDKAELFEEYALYGGLPLVLSRVGHNEKSKYLKDLFEEVYFKDVEERYEIRNKEALRLLTDDICSSIGSLTNPSKIEKTLKSVKHTDINSQTIFNYLEHLKEAFLFSEAKRYDVKGKKYFEYPNKYYCTDIGLRNARLNFRQQEETHIMENVIYNELITRGYNVDVGVVTLIQTDDNGKRHKVQCEIDFVINDGTNKYYIQSALNMDNQDKAKQELRPLLLTKDFFKKIVVSKTRMKPWIDDNGVVHVGIYDFLLDESLI